MLSFKKYPERYWPLAVGIIGTVLLLGVIFDAYTFLTFVYRHEDVPDEPILKIDKLRTAQLQTVLSRINKKHAIFTSAATSSIQNIFFEQPKN